MTVHIKVDPPLERVSTSAHHVSTQEFTQCVVCLIQALFSEYALPKVACFSAGQITNECVMTVKLSACTFSVFYVNYKC